MASDLFGAFVPGPRALVEPLAQGALSGRNFAVKDLIDVAGYVTGGGNPDWAADQVVASAHAPSVRAALEAGATLCGKTVTDELAFSLEGDNAHFPLTLNPLDASRLSGGSSSGSAVAVAAELADFALGTDTGGSVRVPAAFCGLSGFRPTHGRISLAGVLPFAPSLDTVGWLAREASLLAAVGEVLLGEAPGSSPTRFLIAEDAFDLCDPGCAEPLRKVAAQFAAEPISLMSDASRWHQTYRAIQGREIAETLGPWIRHRAPHFGPTIAPRFADALTISDDEVARAKSCRDAMREKMRNLLPDGMALILPTTPGLALKRGLAGEEIGHFYQRALALNAVAGLCGLPQATLPMAMYEDLPLSISFVMAAGYDKDLLALAKKLKP